MKRIFRTFLIIFSIVFSLSSGVMFSACKSKGETSIDMTSAYSHFHAFILASNTFLNSKIQAYSINENVHILQNIVGNDSEGSSGGINDLFDSAVQSLKVAAITPEYTGSDASLIKKTANSMEITLENSSIAIVASEDLLSQKVTIKSEDSTLLYEFICEGEGKYKAQLVMIFEENQFNVYQFNFNGGSGTLVIFQDSNTFSSIFENGVGETFANEAGATYLFK